MSDQEQVGQGAYLSQRHRLENITAKPKVNETWAGACAIAALVVYIVIVAVQYVDYSSYLGQ
ncbi:MAG: hypothetical protein GX230_10320 [Lentisphaerae bacterium]|jgi:hypothetical protein|nr:hypothetical protein [Lentisphaerota bacterium]